MTLWSNEAERMEVEQLRGVCHQVTAVPLPKWRSLVNCLKGLPSRIPLQAVYSWNPELARQIHQNIHNGREAEAYDIVHVEHLRGARYGLSIQKLARFPGQVPPVVWDSVDSISLLFRQASGRSSSWRSRWMTRFELERTERYEGWLAGQFERTLVTSPNDRKAFSDLMKDDETGEAVGILPNGVDLDYFHPDPAIQRDPNTLVMSGKMSYHANISMVEHFATRVMPLIWREKPEARLVVVGKDPPPRILELGKKEGIHITGTLPDIRPYLCSAAVAVAPITYGVGIQNKVLEAMACATPVISTPQAVSALQARPGQDLVVAEGEEGLAKAALRMLSSREEQAQVGCLGRQYVEKYHRWENIVSDLEEVYHENIWNQHHIVERSPARFGVD